MHSLKLVDYLHVQADNSLYIYYLLYDQKYNSFLISPDNLA